jgi:hypothetical protein
MTKTQFERKGKKTKHTQTTNQIEPFLKLFMQNKRAFDEECAIVYVLKNHFFKCLQSA